MTDALVVKVGVTAGKSLLNYLKALLDPHMRRRLDEEITLHVLSEIPRVKRLLEERIDEVAASGCTAHEANIIAHQVIEAQQRTLDEEKRRRLSNVLVNGLCVDHWKKARHRLMVRFATELEEEHVDCLRSAMPAFGWRRGYAIGGGGTSDRAGTHLTRATRRGDETNPQSEVESPHRRRRRTGSHGGAAGRHAQRASARVR